MNGLFLALISSIIILSHGEPPFDFHRVSSSSLNLMPGTESCYTHNTANCALLCNSEPGCKVFEFDPTSKRCDLLKGWYRLAHRFITEDPLSARDVYIEAKVERRSKKIILISTST